MKKIILITAILALSLSQLGAQQVPQPFDTTGCFFPLHKSCAGKIISHEHKDLKPDFTMNAVCYFFDTTTINGMEWQLPPGWNIIQTGGNTAQVFKRGDSLLLSFIISIPDINHLPFYPQYMEIKLWSNQEGHGVQTTTMAGKVYFTPYNSIEIWNLEDFYDLKRRWLEEDSLAPQQRVYIPWKEIPQSDLGDDPSPYERNPETWEHWWIDNFREVEVKGLAYAVLMKPVPPDSLDYYEEMYAEETGGEMEKAKKTFTGTIKGKITSLIKRDYGANKEIGLAGLHVRLMRKYGGVYYNFGEAYTDEEGNFTVSYHESRSGSKAKLYLRVFSETNETYNIRSRKFWGGVYDMDIYLGEYGQNAGSVNKGSLRIAGESADAFRAAHWAWKGINYFERQSAGIGGGLRIKINASIGSGANNYVYVNDPAIHLETGDGAHENTIYHEFGHYAMYRLQGNKMKIPFAEDGVSSHSWLSENTGLLAWIEGWANAVQMILDAAHWKEDNEYGLDEV
ncbi:MAG: hypothetical protein LBV02_03235, partial [Bacteroidales bacterium]|nr:hypothetical protein [Bacteroidales bacterium]